MKKIMKILEEHQKELRDTDLEEMPMEFVTKYGGIGSKINTNVLQINFPGTHECFFFFSIPDSDMKTYTKNLDKYPIYYVDFIDPVEFQARNIKELLSTFINKKHLKKLSDKTIEQSIPILYNEY